MRAPGLFLVFLGSLFFLLLQKGSTSSTNSISNDRASSSTASSPVIGVMSEPLHNNRSSADAPRRRRRLYYIAASYVKWLEVGGARSVPIPYDAPPALLDEIFPQINGLLLPGGGADMPRAVAYLLDRIVDGNNRGMYFPVWGTCLGFEFLVAYAGGRDAVQSGFDAENVSLPLESVKVKQLYKDPVAFETVSTRNVTMNNHMFGIEPDHFLQNDNLSLLWDITSINHDRTGRPFVSTIEPFDPERFPIYGVQVSAGIFVKR